MRFGSQEVPGSIFKFARDKMLELEQFTPAQMREHIIVGAAAELEELSTIKTNQQIIAERVMRACIAQLSAAGQLISVKRGMWARSVDGAGLVGDIAQTSTVKRSSHQPG